MNIDMITQFNVDHMHCVLLGVTINLFKIYLNKDKAIKPIYTNIDINNINTSILLIQITIPNMFVRKARSLDDIDRYKATELRQLLLYTEKNNFKIYFT